MSKANPFLFALLFLFSSVATCEPLKDISSDRNNIGQIQSNSKRFLVQLQTANHERIPINQFHHWIIALLDATGKPVYPAQISISGGMPAHGHGLPTQPIVTKYLGNGRYLIEGMKFNMSGQWVIQFHIVTQTDEDTAKLDVEINY